VASDGTAEPTCATDCTMLSNVVGPLSFPRIIEHMHACTCS
jgi:hypothetical protein